ncbi:MAG TPA: PQQ-binding-like beta-propeller repeat protein [Vicinamibacterales bacterium]
MAYRSWSIPAATFLVSAALAAAAPRPDFNWPSFRGADATGVAPDGTPPVSWDLETGRNVAWSTRIPGLGHSSPVVWGNRVFLTTAVPVGDRAADAEMRVDLQDGTSVATETPLAWKLYCLDRETGTIVWERTAHTGIPRVKRHSKASQASATPATDGRHVVAMMGSEGLFAYDMDGKLLWTHDLGRLNQGYVDDPTVEWSPGSSPIIHDGLVIVQNDRHEDSYLVAFDVETGRERWRMRRDEMPAWSTPVVHRTPRLTLVTNSPRYIRGHDPASGRELWRIEDGTQVKVVTPVIAGDLVIVTGGYPTGGRPIFGIRAATGEIVWKLDRGSSYTPTPIVYEGILYVCVDNGVLAAYEAASGKRLYQRRLAPDAGGFSASAVAAAGRLYFASEDGDVFVVRAGKDFELLARNGMGEMCLASPAISGDMLLVRTRTHLHALRERAD